MDAVMANMVFHLIPPAVLARVAADLASVTRAGGRLVWSSPDLGPPGPYAVLFHDANRALRRRWLARLANGELTDVARDAAAMRQAQRRADRRILPRAHGAADVAAALDGHFSGQLELPTHEILEDDILDTLLVPSNQAEFLSEISDRAVREEVIRDLMRSEVVPALQEGPAGTAAGLNVQWTLGSFAR
jgi:hypothetical protein